MHDIRIKSQQKKPKAVRRGVKRGHTFHLRKMIINVALGVFLLCYRIVRIAVKRVVFYMPIVAMVCYRWVQKGWRYMKYCTPIVINNIVYHTKKGVKILWCHTRTCISIILRVIKQCTVRTVFCAKKAYVFVRHYDYRQAYRTVRDYDYRAFFTRTWQRIKNLTWRDVWGVSKFIVVTTVRFTIRLVTYLVPRALRIAWYSMQRTAKWSRNNMKTAVSVVFVFMLITSFTLGNIFNSFAATATWTQTTWAGGVGSSTTNQYSSATNITTGTELTMTTTNDWYNTSWPYRNSITIDSTKVSADLTNYPMLVSTTNTDWKTTANGGGVAQSNGGDILFASSSGTKLDHEIETYTASTGELLAWVKIPLLDSDADTVIYIYYGNTTGSLDESNTTGVWSEYVGVWHLGDGDSTASDFYQDSTSSNNDGTLTDADTDSTSVTGKIGSAYDFNGDADYIDIGETVGNVFSGDYTFEAWVNPDATSGNPAIIDGYSGTGLFMWFNVLGTPRVQHNASAKYASTSVSTDTWQHLATTWNGSTTSSFYRNGSADGTATQSTSYGTAANIYFANASRGGGGYFNGTLDEIRISDNEKSADWFSAQYNNHNSPSTFYTVESLDSQLTSAAFDTGQSSSTISQISWSETLPSNTDVRFQIRTAPDSSGSPGTYGDWLGPSGINTFYTDNTGGETVNSNHTDGSNDQWIQYRVFLLTTDGVSSPTLSDVSIQYVANGAPDFNTDYPSASAGGVSATQNADGSVTINYSVRDTDSTSGSATPGYITPSFEYSLNGGSSWSSITSGYLGGSDLSNKSVDELTYTVHTATWDAPGQTDAYVTNAQIRVTADDNEGGNNTATATSANFILDTSSPTFGSPGLYVDNSSSPAGVTLSCSDDTSMTMQVGLESDLSDASYVTYASSSNLSGLSDPDTVYARCKDSKGNTTSITSATTPNTPTNMFYQDISDPSQSDYRLFIAWSVVSEPTPGFNSYKLYRSTDGSSYSLLTSIANRSTNYYIDDGLSTGTTYYYKLTAVDDNGNISQYSSVVSDDPDGTGGSDLAAPSISSVATSGLSATGVTMTWTTDELSNSTVYYEATASDPGTTPGNYDSSQGVGSFVTSHSVVLDNLTPGTQYYYLVTSTDPSSNQGIATSSGTFTTSSGPNISGVSIPSIFNEQATVTWTTDIASDSTVYYSINSDLSSASQLGSSDDVTSHSVTLTGLTSGTKYYLYVESEDSSSNTTTDKNVVEGEIQYYSFTTTSDSTAPVITSVSAALVGETGATIAWTTDEGATSQVEWGTTTALGTTTTETSVYTTQHAVTLTGLSNTTDYYYKVISSDRADNQSIDDNSGATYSFTTLSPSTVTVTTSRTESIFVEGGDDTTGPALSDILVTPISDSVARVTFDTDEVANAQIDFGTDTNYSKTAGTTDVYHFDHEILLTNLNQGVTYYYQITSADTNDNVTVSDNRTFVMSTPVATDDFALDADLRTLLTELSDTDSLSGASELAQEAIAGLRAAGVDVSLGGDATSFVGEGGLTIVNPQIINLASNSADLVWTTSQPAKTVVEVINLQTNETRRYDDISFLRNHSVALNGLRSQVSYTARITVEDEEGNIAVSSLIPFSTIVNNDPVTISQVETNSTLIPGRSGKVQTIVSWITNKPATSRVYYDDDMSNTELRFSTDYNQSFVTEHVVIISDFNPGVIYRLHAESTDGASDVAISPDYSILTPRSRENIVDVIIENVEETFGVLGGR